MTSAAEGSSVRQCFRSVSVCALSNNFSKAPRLYESPDSGAAESNNTCAIYITALPAQARAPRLERVVQKKRNGGTIRKRRLPLSRVRQHSEHRIFAPQQRMDRATNRPRLKLTSRGVERLGLLHAHKRKQTRSISKRQRFPRPGDGSS